MGVSLLTSSWAGAWRCRVRGPLPRPEAGSFACRAHQGRSHGCHPDLRRSSALGSPSVLVSLSRSEPKRGQEQRQRVPHSTALHPPTAAEDWPDGQWREGLAALGTPGPVLPWPALPQSAEVGVRWGEGSTGELPWRQGSEVRLSIETRVTQGQKLCRSMAPGPGLGLGF